MARQILIANKKVRLEIFETNKYKQFTPAETRTLEYDITGFEMISGFDAYELEKGLDSTGIDDYHDYVVLHLKDGGTATFRNSYVDIFEAV